MKRVTVKQLKEDLEHASHVISDLLQEKGIPEWISQLTLERSTLLLMAQRAARYSEAGERRRMPREACCSTANSVAISNGPHGAHDAWCTNARLLRALGGPAEVERQQTASANWMPF